MKLCLGGGYRILMIFQFYFVVQRVDYLMVIMEICCLHACMA